MGGCRPRHKTQRSAFASAPARWYSEGRAFTAAFVGSGSDPTAATGTGGDGGTPGYSYTVTREEPYEFSRRLGRQGRIDLGVQRATR